jgi:hypothetical protein
MFIIKANQGIATQVNTFTCEAFNRQALIDVLIESARSVCHLPGWLSANIHRGLDGTHVVNYAQSESHEASQQIIEKLRAEGFLDRNKLVGEAHPGLYEVVFTLQRSNENSMGTAKPGVHRVASFAVASWPPAATNHHRAANSPALFGTSGAPAVAKDPPLSRSVYRSPAKSPDSAWITHHPDMCAFTPLEHFGRHRAHK